MRRRARSRAIAMAMAFAATVGASAPEAAAQAASTPRAELQRFEAAQRLFDQKRYAEALALFQKVHDDTRSPNARLMAARCLLALGRMAEGYDELSATVTEAAARAPSEPKYARTRDAAAAELAVLEPKLGKIVIALAQPGATVRLNDVTLAPERLGVPIAMAPGVASIVATRPDGASLRWEQRVGAGETKTITLVFRAVASAEVAAVAPPPPPPEPVREDVGGVRIAGIVVAGLGAVGMGVFAGTYVVAQNDYDTLKSACGAMRCTDAKYGAVVDAGKRAELISNVSVVAGAVALGSGIAMIAFGGPSKKGSRNAGASSRATIDVSPGGFRVGFGTSF